MKDMSLFKIIFTGIFVLCIVLGLVIFAFTKGSSSSQSASILVWGTISSETFNAALGSSSLINNKSITITYEKKDQATFDTDFVEALADGKGPDMVIVRDDFIYKNKNRLFIVPYKNFSERDFKDKFIEEGELFLSKTGIVAFPFIVDPMVMYWNRDIFSNSSLAQPPKYWDEFYPLIDKITRRDNNATILKSTIALGEWRNITNAKELVAMLLMQAGTPIVERVTNSDSDGAKSVLINTFNFPVPPGQSAINFYTQFSNPTSPNYTWNRSLPSSLNFFLSGNLATYFGFASEIFGIQQKNPNLNFDVTYVPQVRDAAKKVTFGHMYSLAIVKQSKQIKSVFEVINGLLEPAAIKSLEAATNLPPVRRDLLSDKPSDAFRLVFYNSALIAHSWIDPDSVSSSNTFRDMIESITGGKQRVADALSAADGEINDALLK